MKEFKVNSIGTKLLFILISTIILIVMLLAFITIKISQKAIMNNEIENSKKMMMQTQIYLDSLAKNIEEKGDLIFSNKRFIYDYWLNDKINDINTIISINEKVDEEIFRPMTSSNLNIRSIWMVNENGISIGTNEFDHKMVNSSSFKYDQLVGYPLIEALEEGDRGCPYWVPIHKEELKTYSSKDVISMIRWFRTGTLRDGSMYSGIMIFNINPSIVSGALESLKDLDGRQDSTTWITDSNGTVLSMLDISANISSYDETNNKSLSEEDFYKNIEEADLLVDAYVEKDMLISYAKSSKTGWYVINKVPVESVLTGISAMKAAILQVGIGVIIFAMIVVILITLNLLKEIKKIIKAMKKVEKGDFTNTILVNRKDEFGDLGRSFNSMVNNVKDLIQASVIGSKEVKEVSNNVLRGVEDNMSLSEDVTGLINVISSSLNEEVSSTSNSVEGVALLSNQMEAVLLCYRQVEEASKLAKEYSEKGQIIIKDLEYNSSLMNDEIKKSHSIYMDLLKDSKVISSIIQQITNIADETNLISLNATIESARSEGTASGMGVVANEIRKLAKKSTEEISEIEKTIGQIIGKITDTQKISDKLIEMNQGQVNNVKNTIDAFEQIDLKINQIQIESNKLEEAVQQAISHKDDILLDVENIAQLAEGSYGTSSQIMTASNGQIQSMKLLIEMTNNMKNVIAALEKTVGKFNID